MSATKVCMDILTRLSAEKTEEAGQWLDSVVNRASELRDLILDGYAISGAMAVKVPILEQDLKDALDLLTEAAALREGAKVIGQ